MQVSYNARYRKTTFGNRSNIDKEGEIIIYSKGFRLKGKGAGDQGDLINFAEIKEFYYRDQAIIFVTFAKEKYIIDGTGNLFEQLLIDIYKARNEFLMDALFMKRGKLKGQFEGEFERTSKFGKPINKGNAQIRLHEGGMIIIPRDQDAFALNYDFIGFHEFDDLEYYCKIVMDDGVNIIFSRLGNDFESFQTNLVTALGNMYDRLINGFLKIIFPQFHATVLLKLAAKIKGGKALSLKEITKIDVELKDAIEEFIFEDDTFKQKISVIAEKTSPENTYYGIARSETDHDIIIKWVIYALPEENAVVFSILPKYSSTNQQPEKHPLYFYRIIMEKGTPADKLNDKIREINQALITLNFVTDPCYMDKRQLKHSPYKYALRKIPYLRILRRSFCDMVSHEDITTWQQQALKFLTKCKENESAE
ncbi:hypothetical protein CVV38_01995 [Candidatus Peregrinibacteria bacterium HGW-Peregrinibacteria-1]|jgi:hypothetical protein|nr:MAG: hypothetical protein CVV38_01995 [Candidatus Peregrinibacteria bacterium HGW-Peregrinibacteria-1]